MTIMQKFYWCVASLGNVLTLSYLVSVGGIFPSLLFIASLAYTAIGFYDIFASKHTLNRLYPVVAYLRYFLESYRVEIQQYFIANDTEERPFNREQRSLVYQRAKDVRERASHTRCQRYPPHSRSPPAHCVEAPRSPVVTTAIPAEKRRPQLPPA